MLRLILTTASVLVFVAAGYAFTTWKVPQMEQDLSARVQAMLLQHNIQGVAARVEGRNLILSLDDNVSALGEDQIALLQAIPGIGEINYAAAIGTANTVAEAGTYTHTQIDYNQGLVTVFGQRPSDVSFEQLLAPLRENNPELQIQDVSEQIPETDAQWKPVIERVLSSAPALRAFHLAASPEGYIVSASSDDPKILATLNTDLTALLGNKLTWQEAAARPNRARPSTVQTTGPSALLIGDCQSDVTLLLKANPIGFTRGSAKLDEEAEDILTSVYGLLNDCPTVNAVIEAYTDSQGSNEVNLKLSEKRAQAVRERLIALSLESERLVAKGMGEVDPIADNETKEGRERNRRIEIRLLPRQE